MASVSTYLNFQGQTEEAFTYYASLFGGTIESLMRFSDLPAGAGPDLADEEKNLVMHANMTILNGHHLMATDMLKSMGHEVRLGNNTTISLNLDSREEADRLYTGLSEGGAEGSGMIEEFWGYWGSCQDRFGIRWMFNVDNPQQ